VEDGSPRLVGFFGVESEMERPVVEVVGVDEGLVDREAVFGEVGVAGALRASGSRRIWWRAA